jgi:hypothetical protein
MKKHKIEELINVEVVENNDEEIRVKFNETLSLQDKKDHPSSLVEDLHLH